MLRRDLLKSALASSAGALALASAGAADAGNELESVAAELTKDLYANDGLVLPIPTIPTVSDLAKGRDRTLALGGGGEYYLAWYCGFFHGLYHQGLDMNALSEMVVGTSAGSYMGSSLTSGHFLRLRGEFEFFGHFPSLFTKLTPLSSSNASQQRAVKLSAAAKDGEISTLQTIGRAALAADNRVNGDAVSPRLIWMLTGDSKSDWPVANIYTSLDRLLHRRAAYRQPDRRPQAWDFARAWRCGEFLVAGGDRSDSSGSTLRHGRRYMLQRSSCRFSGGVETSDRDYHHGRYHSAILHRHPASPRGLYQAGRGDGHEGPLDHRQSAHRH